MKSGDKYLEHDSRRGFARIERCLSVLPLTTNELRVYVTLRSFSPCYPNFGQIAKCSGVSEGTARAAVESLANKWHMIRADSVSEGRGSKVTKSYLFRPYATWSADLRSAIEKVQDIGVKKGGKAYLRFTAIPFTACRDPRITPALLRLCLYLDLVRGKRPLPHRELARVVGVRRGQVSTLVDQLIRYGMAEVIRKPSGASGGRYKIRGSEDWRLSNPAVSSINVSGTRFDDEAVSALPSIKQLQTKDRDKQLDQSLDGAWNNGGSTAGRSRPVRSKASTIAAVPDTVGAGFLESLKYWLNLRRLTPTAVRLDVSAIVSTLVRDYGCPYRATELGAYMESLPNVPRDTANEIVMVYRSFVSQTGNQTDPDEAIRTEIPAASALAT